MDIFSFVSLHLTIFNGPEGIICVDFLFPFSIDNSLTIDINQQSIEG